MADELQWGLHSIKMPVLHCDRTDGLVASSHEHQRWLVLPHILYSGIRASHIKPASLTHLPHGATTWRWGRLLLCHAAKASCTPAGLASRAIVPHMVSMHMAHI